METLMNQMKKQASGYLQEKCKTAKLAFTDVSEAELLAEEATNNDPLGPDAKTMTRLAVASFDVDDYWRIVDVLHRRLYCIDWKQWRQSYKALVLLEFLLTHGAEDFAIEFQSDTSVLQELCTFCYIDGKGFNWGANMQKRAENILKLLGGGQILKEARLKAIKITNGIQGFGSSSMASPSPSPSTSTHSPSSSEVSRSSFGSYTTTNSSTWNNDVIELNKLQEQSMSFSRAAITKYSLGDIQKEEKGFHLWDSPNKADQESGSLLDVEDEESNGLFKGICSKLASISPKKLSSGDKKALRSLSDNNRNAKKKYDRQYSSAF